MRGGFRLKRPSVQSSQFVRSTVAIVRPVSSSVTAISLAVWPRRYRHNQT